MSIHYLILYLSKLKTHYLIEDCLSFVFIEVPRILNKLSKCVCFIIQYIYFPELSSVNCTIRGDKVANQSILLPLQEVGAPVAVGARHPPPPLAAGPLLGVRVAVGGGAPADHAPVPARADQLQRVRVPRHVPHTRAVSALSSTIVSTIVSTA